jgi:acyl-CoA thioesterase YciA
MDSESPKRAGSLALRVVMMPRDTNPQGTIFGGILLSYIDQAGAVSAREYQPHRFVTVAMDKVEFKQPVFVGDLLSFYARVVKVGRTSITIHVSVEAQRFADPRETVRVTEAELVYVAVNEKRQPVPVGTPTSTLAENARGESGRGQ